MITFDEFAGQAASALMLLGRKQKIGHGLLSFIGIQLLNNDNFSNYTSL